MRDIDGRFKEKVTKDRFDEHMSGTKRKKRKRREFDLDNETLDILDDVAKHYQTNPTTALRRLIHLSKELI